jgi:hypothetical protein
MSCIKLKKDAVKYYLKSLQQLKTHNNLISQADNKQKVTWNIINSLTNKKTSNDNDPTNVNGKSSTRIANAFNNHFISVADNLLTKNFSKTGITNNDDPMRYLRQNLKRCHSQIKLHNTTTYEINTIINSQKK